MLKLEEVKELYSDNLEGFFGQKGYKFLKSKNEYSKTKGEWICTYFFSFTGWATSVSIQVHLIISHKKLKGILNKVIGYGDHIISAELGRVLYLTEDGRNATLPQSIVKHVSTREEAEASLNEYIELFEKYGEPFFNKYTDIDTVYSLLCDPPFDHSFITGTYFMRVANSIVLESMLKKGDILALVKEYEKEIDSVDNPKMKREFKQLLEYLSIV